MDPRHLITCLVQFLRIHLIPFLKDFGAFLTLISDIIIAGIRVCVLGPMNGSLWGRSELPDPSHALSDLHRGFDLVSEVTGGFIDKGRSKGRVLSKLECAAAHLLVARGIIKPRTTDV